MKRIFAMILVLSLFINTGCSTMTRKEKTAVGVALVVGAVVGLIILGSNNKKKHCHPHRHRRGCGCHSYHR